MHARELMSSPAITIEEQQTLEAAAQLMIEEEIGCLPVVDDRGRLVGILTEDEFMAHEESVPWAFFKAPKLLGAWLDEAHIEEAYRRARSTPVGQIMSTPVQTIGPDDPVSTAVEIMLAYTVNHVPVVEEDEVVGVLARHDLLRLVDQSVPSA